jgi:hypothetical protein
MLADKRIITRVLVRCHRIVRPGPTARAAGGIACVLAAELGPGVDHLNLHRQKRRSQALDHINDCQPRGSLARLA